MAWRILWRLLLSENKNKSICGLQITNIKHGHMNLSAIFWENIKKVHKIFFADRKVKVVWDGWHFKNIRIHCTYQFAWTFVGYVYSPMWALFGELKRIFSCTICDSGWNRDLSENKSDIEPKGQEQVKVVHSDEKSSITKTVKFFLRRLVLFKNHKHLPTVFSCMCKSGETYWVMCDIYMRKFSFLKSGRMMNLILANYKYLTSSNLFFVNAIKLWESLPLDRENI